MAEPPRLPTGRYELRLLIDVAELAEDVPRAEGDGHGAEVHPVQRHCRAAGDSTLVRGQHSDLGARCDRQEGEVVHVHVGIAYQV